MKGFFATYELQRCNLQPLNKNEGIVKQKNMGVPARGLFCWLLTICSCILRGVSHGAMVLTPILFPFLGSLYIHPRNSTYRYQKSPDLKGVTFSKPSLVSMLVFGGCKSTFHSFFWLKNYKHSSSSRKKNIGLSNFLGKSFR